MRVSTAVAAATSALLIAAGKAPSAVATLPVVDGSMGIEDEFGQWMATYSKEYGAGERDARKGIWMENRGRVIAHNRAAADGKYSFTLELNHLADMTNAEYRMKLLGLGGAGPATLADHTFQGNGSVPDAWDWRDTPNVVNPVKNQGQCGSCWAFSAVATMEGAYNLEQKSLNSFSEQELVDCVDGGADNCNVGGEMYKVSPMESRTE